MFFSSFFFFALNNWQLRYSKWLGMFQKMYRIQNLFFNNWQLRYSKQLCMFEKVCKINKSFLFLNIWQLRYSKRLHMFQKVHRIPNHFWNNWQLKYSKWLCIFQKVYRITIFFWTGSWDIQNGLVYSRKSIESQIFSFFFFWTVGSWDNQNGWVTLQNVYRILNRLTLIANFYFCYVYWIFKFYFSFKIYLPAYIRFVRKKSIHLILSKM